MKLESQTASGTLTKHTPSGNLTGVKQDDQREIVVERAAVSIDTGPRRSRDDLDELVRGAGETVTRRTLCEPWGISHTGWPARGGALCRGGDKGASWGDIARLLDEADGGMGALPRGQASA